MVGKKGLSVGNIVSQDMVSSMNKNPIIFANTKLDPNLNFSLFKSPGSIRSPVVFFKAQITCNGGGALVGDVTNCAPGNSGPSD